MSKPNHKAPSLLRTVFQVLGSKTWVVLVFNILGTLSEALGIVLLLPLLSSFGESSVEISDELGIFGSAFEKIIHELQGFAPAADELTLLILLIGGFFLIKGLFTFLAYVIVNVVNGQMMFSLRRDTLHSLARSDFSFFRRHSTGHYANILGEQVQRSFLAVKFLCEFAGMATSALIYVGIALYLNFKFGLLAIVAGVVVVSCFRRLNTRVRDMSLLSADYSSSMQADLIEYIKSFKYFRATGNNDLTLPLVTESFSKLSNVKIKTGVYDSFTLAIREPVLVLMVLSLIYTQTTYFQASIDSILVSILLFYRALNSTVVAQRQWQAALEFFGGIEVSTRLLSDAQNNPESTGTEAPNTGVPVLRFDKVHFNYGDKSRFCLRVRDLSISAGSTIAFIGPSGAGKSTLLDLITIIQEPTSGCLTIDGCDATTLDRVKWRSQIGYVIQDPPIYAKSIAWNITLGKHAHLDRQEQERRLVRATQLANLHDFVISLPDGFETMITEGGGNISGGQRQRIALARELYKEPNILILDEATSALDAESQQVITESVRTLRGAMTIIIVAHRLATLKLVDHIYVIDAGEVIEDGSYDDMLAVPTSYLSKSMAGSTSTQSAVG